MAAPRRTKSRKSSRARRDEGLSEDEKIIREAKDRFKRSEDWEAAFWVMYDQDVQFANADSDNGWQWPDDLRKDREINKRPTLTINKVAPLCRLITNDQRQNKAAVVVRPANQEASYDAAQVIEGVVRQIEYASNAQAIYDDAGDSQVEGGIGFWRVNTRFVDDDERPFDQEIIIEPPPSHHTVRLDCDIRQKDGSDAEWGFLFEDVADEKLEAEHPAIADVLNSSTGLTASDNWTRDGYTRIAEYYRIKKTPDEWIWVDDGNEQVTFRRSEAPEGMMTEIARLEKEDPDKVKRRPDIRKQLEWYKIAGSRIIDRNLKLPGPYIPIVRVVGIERVIRGKLERKGHVRPLKDQQRMYNYNSSGQVEFGALQTKTPWVIAAASVQGNETAWNNANRSNAAYLTYRHKDADGDPIPEPKRNDPPGASPAFVTGMEIADRELAMASGQYNAKQGKDGNEISGKAIQQRQRQGDTAVYHFIDGMAQGIRHTGKIILAWFPHVYDTERVMQILGVDGKQQQIKLDPKAEKAYQKQDQDKDDVLAVFNPRVGKYEVVSDPGPSYATRRQEAWNAFVQIIMGSPELINDIGDYMFQSADFPLADKIAERIRNKIRATQPWLLDDEAPSPIVKQLQGELEQATKQIGELLEKLGDEKRRGESRAQKRDIEAYRAETDRVNKLGNTTKDLEGEYKTMLLKAMQAVLSDIYGEDITLSIDEQQEQQSGQEGENDSAAAPSQGNEQPPVPGARKARDNQWYIEDPSRPGKWARVMTEAQNAA